MALEIAGLATGKKAADVTVLAMSEAVSYTDFFVLATGATTRQTKAIADGILEGLRATRRPARAEGEREAEWILLDFIDVVVHVFTPAAREFYRLEVLWGDVPRVPLSGDDTATGSTVARGDDTGTGGTAARRAATESA